MLGKLPEITQRDMFRPMLKDFINELDICDADKEILQALLDECNELGVPSVQSVSLQIYPNPVPQNGVLYIENTTLKSGDKIEIFDMAGKLVSMHIATGVENSVQIGYIPQGAYLLRLAGRSGVKFEVR